MWGGGEKGKRVQLAPMSAENIPSMCCFCMYKHIRKVTTGPGLRVIRTCQLQEQRPLPAYLQSFWGLPTTTFKWLVLKHTV